MHVEEMKISATCMFLENLLKCLPRTNLYFKNSKVVKTKNKIGAYLLWVSAYSNLATKKPGFLHLTSNLYMLQKHYMGG